MGSILPIFLFVSAAFLSATSASASFVYQSQTGQLGARGGTPDTGLATQQIPISGLVDFDESVGVQDAAPPQAYSASATLQTHLGPNQILLVGSTSADVAGCDPGDGSPCIADALAEVDIRFDLAESEILQFGEGTHSGFNGPVARLRHLDLGFLLSFTWLDGSPGLSIDDCGSLSPVECDPLFEVFLPDGGSVPAGRYQLEFELFAFEPFGGSCAFGCNAAGGSAHLYIVPEPGTGMLLGAGLVAFGLVRGRRAARRYWLQPARST